MINTANTTISNLQTLLPVAACVVCGNTLQQIGGRRITAQKLRGITLTHSKSGAGHINFRRWLTLFENQSIYVLVWGEKSMMTDSVIDRIKSTYLDGFRAWFCQAHGCGNRQCTTCGKAINLPVASDLLYNDGRSSHLMIIPADLGCTNGSCKKYRKLDDSWEIAYS